jgi:predicted phage replisome organizer
MAEKRYFWLKLYDDFFTSKRIKKLRSVAGGDTYTIIYLKMQLKALKTEGYLYFDGVMSDFAEELALDIDESVEDVKVTINYLMSVGLLETNDGEEYKLPFLDKCIGSENASAQRVREHRAKQKALQCNTDVTEVKQVCNAEIDIEKDKEIDKSKSNKFTPPTLEEVQAYCKERNNTVDAETFINFYESKGWYVGKNKMKDWRACVRTWERNRDNKKTEKKNQFNNFQQSNYDWDEINRELGIQS